MTHLITATGLHRDYRRSGVGVPALIDVDVAITAGKLTVLAGASGSGKTTLLSILGGMDRPDRGQVTLHPPLPDGADPADLDWRHIGHLPQALALMDELTVAENVQLPARIAGRGDLTDAEHTAQWLERLDLVHLADKYPTQTSGGEQQRTALARALRLNPMLLLADEPTGQQDHSRVKLVLEALTDMADAGRAVVITTHDPEVIEAADQVITLRDGRVAD